MHDQFTITVRAGTRPCHDLQVKQQLIPMKINWPKFAASFSNQRRCTQRGMGTGAGRVDVLTVQKVLDVPLRWMWNWQQRLMYNLCIHSCIMWDAGVLPPGIEHINDSHCDSMCKHTRTIYLQQLDKIWNYSLVGSYIFPASKSIYVKPDKWLAFKLQITIHNLGHKHFLLH